MLLFSCARAHRCIYQRSAHSCARAHPCASQPFALHLILFSCAQSTLVLQQQPAVRVLGPTELFKGGFFSSSDIHYLVFFKAW
mmetsp:Transcript_37610/g.62278  ORF Transcript_37610/g.62278 Transcript_37610/m.62278 type:complete len:83 (-) Transcript_37610:15-263(-)